MYHIQIHVKGYSMNIFGSLLFYDYLIMKSNHFSLKMIYTPRVHVCLTDIVFSSLNVMQTNSVARILYLEVPWGSRDLVYTLHVTITKCSHPFLFARSSTHLCIRPSQVFSMFSIHGRISFKAWQHKHVPQNNCSGTLHVWKHIHELRFKICFVLTIIAKDCVI